MEFPLATVTTANPLDALSLKRRIIALAQDYSIETTPRESAGIASYSGMLPAGTNVNIAFLPGGNLGNVVDIAVRLRTEGLNPVPHLPARAFASEAAFREIIGRLRDVAAVTDALVIAGDLARPLGPFSDSVSLLETELLARHGVLRVGVAGHPEGSPDIAAASLRRALADKNAFAKRSGAKLHLATQFCLDAAPIITWEAAIRGDGNILPIDVGLPGATTLKSLLKFAKLCGVGASRRALVRNTRKLVRLGAVSYPDRLVTAIAAHMQIDPTCHFRRLHFYPFGGLERTASWLRRVAAGAFELNGDLDGFDLLERID